MDPASTIRGARRLGGLSQRELGRLAGTSGATIAAYEAGTKIPRADTLERIVSASGCTLRWSLEPPPSARDLSASRSLAIHRVVAGRLRSDPDGVRSAARQNLQRLRRAHRGGRSDRWFDEWEALLDAPIDELHDALIAPDQAGVDRRQSSPFATLIDSADRWAIIRSTREADRAS